MNLKNKWSHACWVNLISFFLLWKLVCLVSTQWFLGLFNLSGNINTLNMNNIRKQSEWKYKKKKKKERKLQSFKKSALLSQRTPGMLSNLSKSSWCQASGQFSTGRGSQGLFLIRKHFEGSCAVSVRGNSVSEVDSWNSAFYQSYFLTPSIWILFCPMRLKKKKKSSTCEESMT